MKHMQYTSLYFIYLSVPNVSSTAVLHVIGETVNLRK